jgi:hypothetical protein
MKLNVIHNELHILFAQSRKILAVLKQDDDEEAAADALLAEIEKATAELPPAN